MDTCRHCQNGTPTVQGVFVILAYPFGKRVFVYTSAATPVPAHT